MVLYLTRIDPEMQAAIDEAFGDSVLVQATVTVLDGSLEDYDVAITSGAVAGSDTAAADNLGLKAVWCG